MKAYIRWHIILLLFKVVQCLVEVHWKLFKPVLKCLECSGLDSDPWTFSSLTQVPQWIWQLRWYEFGVDYFRSSLLLLLLLLAENHSFVTAFCSDSLLNAVPFADKWTTVLPSWFSASLHRHSWDPEVVTQFPCKHCLIHPHLSAFLGVNYVWLTCFLKQPSSLLHVIVSCLTLLDLLWIIKSSGFN